MTQVKLTPLLCTACDKSESASVVHFEEKAEALAPDADNIAYYLMVWVVKRIKFNLFGFV